MMQVSQTSRHADPLLPPGAQDRRTEGPGAGWAIGCRLPGMSFMLWYPYRVPGVPELGRF